MTARVLVTGASGFVARHALAPLAARGFEVHAVSHADGPGGRTSGSSAVWHSCDLLDREARERLLAESEPSHLLHAAWYLEPGVYTRSARNLDWVAASIDFARSFHRQGGSRIVTVGSCFEYEHGHSPVLSETAPLRPSTVYGLAKKSLFIAIEALAAATSTSTAWARLFYLYGPGEDRRRLIGDIASSVIEGRVVATSPGLARRDYMYIEDAGDALAAIVASDVTGPVNVATGDAPPVRDLVDLIARAAGRPELVKFGARPAPENEPSEIRADVTRLRSEVKWTGVTPTGDAVERTVDWWRANVVATA